ncbi:MAG TPA: peptidoglycan-associated lipoprotein Pal [Candidatus Angelobacter sp.]|nr:peptidoglycan-associated lipoprotein Pal [Candidatus Angelobacter sp.]
MLNHRFVTSFHPARILMLSVVIFLAACSTKKAAKVTPPTPPTPPPASPTATLAANPATILAGQSAVLTWQTANANDITIEGLGTVPASGSRRVTPGTSQTYTLAAAGAGGRTEASARITVNPAAQTATAQLDTGSQLSGSVADVYFNYDDARLRSDGASVATKDASFLKQHSNLHVMIEGHCDDRGSDVYNLALGESRANAVKDTLISQGVDSGRIKTISYGKEKPFCTEENESCWQQNRRGHFVVQQ